MASAPVGLSRLYACLVPDRQAMFSDLELPQHQAATPDHEVLEGPSGAWHVAPPPALRQLEVPAEYRQQRHPLTGRCRHHLLPHQHHRR